MKSAVAVVAVLAIALLSGCLYTSYVTQAAQGQFQLLGKAKPIDQVVNDPDTPLRVAILLAEIPSIKMYGRRYGLKIRKNYETYSSLGRPAAVWFTAAADPVAFKPRKWCFPIVGCFAGLGWFDEDEAVAFKQKMEAAGYDAIVRPASAYSTGGWFPDPVLSTMLGGGDDALPELFNVIIHESVHATVLVPDEPFFNESLASYVADTLTDAWIAERFGPGSPEHVAWTLGQALHLPRVARLLAAYKALKTVYESKATREQKLASKAKIIDELVADLKLRKRPNNASLTEVRVYNGGTAPLILAHRACGDLRALVESAKTLRRSDFQKSLQEDLTGIGQLIGQRCATKKLDQGIKSAHDSR
ncbi:MAG TPA: aminopeptidase [Kofleriaceae bacterium]|nr:aminopeptidase [Kofleriaceae bacterium]